MKYRMFALPVILFVIWPATIAAQATPGSGLPIGTIVAYGGEFTAENVSSLLQSGWVPCDGRALRHTKPGTNQPTEFAALFRTIGENFGEGYEEGATDKEGAAAKKGDFNVPDCRGRFLRGVDDNSGRDPDRGRRTPMRFGGNSGDRVGSIQADAYEQHDHGASAHNDLKVFSSVTRPSGELQAGLQSGTAFDDKGTGAIARGTSSVSVDVNPNGEAETRPVNIYVNWIIKYR